MAEHPRHEALIRAYYTHWHEMLGGAIEATVGVLRDLREAGRCRLIALTNWSAETFPVALERYDFLHWFEGIVVSGAERLAKPDPAIYRLLCERHGVVPARALFTDDAPRNIEAARALGMHAVPFTGADALREALIDHGLLPA
ncbi:HAD-IA family hydrolase [Frateuria defendens]|uniref:HAD-IA family hydrolase n=1 Tax=Frateuria defendens TaxID=2219559 RepID=UPI00301B4624